MMLFPAVLMNVPNSEVCLIGEWSIIIYLILPQERVAGSPQQHTPITIDFSYNENN